MVISTSIDAISPPAAEAEPVGLSTLAGNGGIGMDDGGPGAATFDRLEDLAISNDGLTLYAVDQSTNLQLRQHSIRKIDIASGNVTTMSTGGLLVNPKAIDVDAAGTAFVSVEKPDAPHGGAIIKIDPSGEQSVLTDDAWGTHTGAVVLSPDESMLYYGGWVLDSSFVEFPALNLFRISTAGGTSENLGSTGQITRGAIHAMRFADDGKLYLNWTGTTTCGFCAERLWRFLEPGFELLPTQPGDGYFARQEAFVFAPGSSTMYATCSAGGQPNNGCDAQSSVVRRQGYGVGSPHTIVGGDHGYQDGFPGKLDDPSGLAISPTGTTVYIADRDNRRIRKTALPPDRPGHFGWRTDGGYASDPVNTYSGNFVQQTTDLPAPNGVYGATWSKTYNHQDAVVRALGVGWSHSFSAQLLQPANSAGAVQLTEPDGRRTWFEPVSTGVWAPPDGVRADLRFDETSSSFSLQYWTGERWEFDASGRLVRLCEGRPDWGSAGESWCDDPTGGGYTGQFVDVSWNGNVPTGAVSSTGYALTFTDANADGRIDSVSSSDGRMVTYVFDAIGQPSFLTKMQGPVAGSQTRYVPDASGRIREVWEVATSAERLKLINVYDSEDRVHEQYTDPVLSGIADPGGDKATFEYDTPTVNTTTVTHDDRSGGVETLLYAHDVEGRLVEVTDAHGNPVTKAWDNAQPAEVVDRSDATWRNDYDAKGRLCRRWLANPVSGGIGLPETFLYQGQSTVCDGVGTDPRLLEFADASNRRTRYEYDPGDLDGVPSRVIRGYGTSEQSTTVLESTADLVTQSTDPDGIVTTFHWDTTLRRLLAQTTGGKTTYFGYDSAGRRNVVRTPLGNETWSVFDPASNVTRQVGPVHVNRSCGPTSCAFEGTPPSGAGVPTVEMEYWPNGTLKSRKDEANNVWLYDTVYLLGGGHEELTTDPEGNLTVVRYDRAGRMTERIDPSDPQDEPGLSTTTTYDYYPLGRLRKVTDPTGRETHYCYDADGRTVLEATGSLGSGAFVDCLAPQANLIRTESTYDKQGRVSSVTTGKTTTAAGLVTSYVYDEVGRVLEVVGPAAPSVPLGSRPKTVYTYDGQGRRDTVTDPVGLVTDTDYTPGGKVDLVTEVGSGLKTKHLYDSVTGWLDEVRGPVTDPLASTAPVTAYGYDDDGRVVSVEAPEGDLTETLAYDAAGRPLQVRDAGGVITDYTWSMRGDLERQTTALGTPDEVEIAFDDYRFDGQVITVRDGLGNPTTYGYTTRGERKSRTDSEETTESWRYDTAGRLVAHVDPLLRTSTMAYDEHGRIDVEVGADGRTIDRDWTSQGQPAQVVYNDGAAQQTVTYVYDDFGRRLTMTDPTGTTISLHDPAGRPLLLAAPGGRNTLWGYDGAGQRSVMGLPDGTVLQYSYDPTTGQLSTVRPRDRVADTFTAPDGAVMDNKKWTTNGSSPGASVLTAGGAARLQFDTSGGTAQLQYKASDKLADSSVAVRYRFEDNAPDAQFGLYARASGTKNYRVTLNADATAGELWKLSGGVSTKLGEFPTVADTNWHFLRMEVQGNQLRVRTWDNPWIEPTTWNLEVTDNSVTGTGNNQASFTRLGAGPQPARAMALDQVTITNPSAAEPALATYGWDKQGRLISQTSPDGSRSWDYGDGRLDTYTQNVPDAAFTTDLGYDAAGRIATETTAGATTSYDYDSAGQLTQVAGPGGTESYTYDDLGRRTTKSIAGAVTTYNYDDADQLTSTTGAESTTYTWDAAGRMLTSKTGATTTSFTYDPAGQLATEKRGGTTLTRTVNGDGQLTAVTNQSGATTRIDWDTSQPIPEPSLFTTTANQATTLTDTAGTTTAYRQGDTNKALPLDVYGSALKTSASNGLAGAAGYDAFGNPTTTIGFADIRLGYRGELTEANTVHLRNRQYNPATGSFTTRDPLDGVDGTPTVTNPYHYADNDPVNKADPSGLRPGDESPPLVVPAAIMGGIPWWACGPASWLLGWCDPPPARRTPASCGDLKYENDPFESLSIEPTGGTRTIYGRFCREYEARWDAKTRPGTVERIRFDVYGDNPYATSPKNVGPSRLSRSDTNDHPYPSGIKGAHTRFWGIPGTELRFSGEMVFVPRTVDFHEGWWFFPDRWLGRISLDTTCTLQ